VLKSASSVQLLPFQNSVSESPGGVAYPPKINAEVEVPAVPPAYLSVLMSAISVQEVPSHSSTESVK
jgi:hypothetical protein